MALCHPPIPRAVREALSAAPAHLDELAAAGIEVSFGRDGRGRLLITLDTPGGSRAISPRDVLDLLPDGYHDRDARSRDRRAAGRPD